MSEEETEETQVQESEEQSESGGDGGNEKLQMDSEEVNQQIKEVEENPPDRLEDWPDGPAKYRTIGGGDANEAWEDGPTKHLGPSDVRYFEDGSVTVKGEKVSNPEDFKGPPIPGGPTDPDAPDDPSGIADDDDKTKDDAGDGVEGSVAGGGDQSREDAADAEGDDRDDEDA